VVEAVEIARLERGGHADHENDLVIVLHASTLSEPWGAETVMVATVRGLKAHTGRYRVVAGRPLPPELMRENPDDVYKGGSNLLRQIENIQLHGVNVVVAINAFDEDFESEHEAIRVLAGEMGVPLGTVKGRMRMGLEKMRTFLQARGVTV